MSSGGWVLAGQRAVLRTGLSLGCSPVRVSWSPARLVGRRHVGGRVVRGEQPLQQRAGEPAERPARAHPVEHGHLELRRRRGCAAGRPPGPGRAAPPPGRAPRTGSSRAASAPVSPVAICSACPPIATKPLLVRHRAVVGQPVDLVVLRRRCRPRRRRSRPRAACAPGEHGAQGLGVGVGQPAGGDVGAVVGVAAQVGVPDAGRPAGSRTRCTCRPRRTRSGRRSR